jgi:heme/copper-type cytochrome/quinol oxidase subunit 2
MSPIVDMTDRLENGMKLVFKRYQPHKPAFVKNMTMKKFIIIVLIAIFICSAFLTYRTITSIYGTIDPPESVSKVIAIKEKDSLVVIPSDGRFSIKVTAGTWRLYFVALSPYKDMFAENIRVRDDRSTDVGVIRLVTK